jgi:hypothetical protein
MLNYSLALLLAAIAGTSWAVETELYEGECGQSVFQVVVENGAHPLDHKFTLSTVGTNNDKTLFVSNEGGWFHVACLQTANGEPLLVIQSYCGGSACVEGKYGVVDPSTLKFLLRPSRKNIENRGAASKLLGYAVPHLGNYKDSFCCSK